MTNVLIAEDDPHIQLLIRKQLEVAGYRVWATLDGEEALRHALEQPPDILVLDIMLPGKDGLEICRQVKEHFGAKAPPVIIISARGQEMDVEAGDSVGADDYIIKPFSPRALLEHVQALLDR
ncbi:MAG TPA: response regulator [Aggregatilineales bacterium]|nr:response regulator [Aggregatilineales bacterium]